MSAGYGFDPEAPPASSEGLDAFDEDQAANDLASVEDDERARQEALAASEPGTVSPAPSANDAELLQGGSEPDGAHTAVPVGSTPTPATDAYPELPQFPELGPPPAPPQLTGNPQQDVISNVAWQRAAAAHHDELMKRQTALATHAAQVGAMRGKKEAEAAGVAADRKTAEVQRAAAVREQRQLAIDEAVKARVAAAGDVEGFKWDRPHTGKEIAAIILGGIGAGFGNAAAAQLGQVGHNENEAAKGIDARMKREYDSKVTKLKAAGDSLLMARHDAKDAQEAHRAAMNDLDAEQAAKNKAIAADATAALLQAGVPKAQVAGNVIVAEANARAAAHEGEIHQREEGHADQRTQAAATLALARANLGERRSEHAENLEDRKAARADKAEKHDVEVSDKKEARLFRDPRTGEKYGYASNAKAVNQMADKAAAIYAYADKAREMADHIEKHQGDPRLLIPTSDLYKERETIAADTQAMGRPAKGIQASDAGLKLEHQIVGGNGLGLNRTANPRVLRQLAADAEKQLMYKLRAGLEPLEGNKALAPLKTKANAPKDTIDAPGGIKYELGADGNYHKVK